MITIYNTMRYNYILPVVEEIEMNPTVIFAASDITEDFSDDTGTWE